SGGWWTGERPAARRTPVRGAGPAALGGGLHPVAVGDLAGPRVSEDRPGAAVGRGVPGVAAVDRGPPGGAPVRRDSGDGGRGAGGGVHRARGGGRRAEPPAAARLQPARLGRPAVLRADGPVAPAAAGGHVAPLPQAPHTPNGPPAGNGVRTVRGRWAQRPPGRGGGSGGRPFPVHLIVNSFTPPKPPVPLPRVSRGRRPA